MEDADGKLKWIVPSQSFEHDNIILLDAGVAPRKFKETSRPQVPVDILLIKRMFRQALLTGTSPDKLGDPAWRLCELCRRYLPQPFPLTCAICLSTIHQSACLLPCLKASGAKECIIRCRSARTLPSFVSELFCPQARCHMCRLIMCYEESAFEECRPELMPMSGPSENRIWEAFSYVKSLR